MDSFIVSARKYRPATFESVVGQTHITSTLKNAISRNQLAHAYLFCGPRGVGKTTCARIFAKAINCTNPNNNEACGECESCRSFNEGRSFNIHELDAASNNSVDDIRALTEQVRIPPQVGRYSVYIIDEVHMLSAAAFNAFLKTLEEPPAHAVFILATTEKHKIIPTILSRCQIYDFNRIKVEDSVSYLKHIAASEGVQVDDESLNLIAQKADGGMRDALSMFDKAVAFGGMTLNFKDVARTLNVLDYDTYFTITDLAGAGDYKGALTLFDEVLKKGFSGLTFISGLNTHFRDLLMCKDPATMPLLEVTGTLLDRYKEQSTRYDAAFLFQAISLVSAVDNGFRNATNQRLHVELGLMKLCALGQKKTELTSPAAELPTLQKEGSTTSAAPAPTVSATPTAQAPQPAVQSTPQTPVETETTVAPQLMAQPIAEPLAPVIEPIAPPAQEVQQSIVQQEVEQPTAPQMGEPIVADAPAVETAPTVEATPAVEPKPIAEQPAPQVETAPAPAPAPTPTPIVEQPTIEQSAPQVQPIVEQAPIAEPAPQSVPQVQEVPVQPAEPVQSTQPQPQAPPTAPTTTTAQPAASRGVSGISIADIMNGSTTRAASTEEEGATINQSIDPQTEQKLGAVREKFLADMSETRPRLAVVLENMIITGNVISLTVASDVLKEEIVSHQKEIFGAFYTLAGVQGAVDLNITVKENVAAIKPIRPEDKLEHLRAKNPAIDDLRREFNLEMD